jgi:hypothetical protein
MTLDEARISPLPPLEVRPMLSGAAGLTLVVPDSQHGYRWTQARPGEPARLVPTHDPDAIACVIAAARELRPGRIVLLGDMLDLPEGSLRWGRRRSIRMDALYHLILKIFLR